MNNTSRLVCRGNCVEASVVKLVRSGSCRHRRPVRRRCGLRQEYTPAFAMTQSEDVGVNEILYPPTYRAF